jgi:hypothetical protein
MFASVAASRPVEQGFVACVELASASLDCVEPDIVVVESLPVVLAPPLPYATPMDGSVGLSFLSLWRWMSIDASAARLTLGNRAEDKPVSSEVVQLRRRGTANHVLVPVSIDGIGAMDAIVDTAATSDIVIGWSALTGPAWDEVLVNPRKQTVQTATTEMSAVVGTLATPLRIGNREFVGLRVLTLDDTKSPEWAKIPLIVGAPLLTRLGRVTIDFETMEMEWGEKAME